MIKGEVSSKIAADIESLMIKSENVANVISEHSAINALMVLSNAKYSVIPVLSIKSELVGLINMQVIIESCTTDNSIDFAILDDKKIEDINLIEAVKVKLTDSVEYLLYKLIDNNFVCVVNNDNIFLGIVTRRNLLKELNRLLHSL